MFEHVPKRNNIKTLFWKHTGLQNPIADINSIRATSKIRHPAARLDTHRIEATGLGRDQRSSAGTPDVEKPQALSVRPPFDRQYLPQDSFEAMNPALILRHKSRILGCRIRFNDQLGLGTRLYVK